VISDGNKCRYLLFWFEPPPNNAKNPGEICIAKRWSLTAKAGYFSSIAFLYGLSINFFHHHQIAQYNIAENYLDYFQ